MSKHTPGPWIAMQNEPGGSIYVWAKSQRGIEGEKPLFGTFADQREHVDHEANARLIAAAPEMLGVLKELMAAPYQSRVDMVKYLSEFEDRLRAAIAKAEGK